MEQEAPKIIFLRTEDFNPWAAAARLAWYWKYRKRAFGEERWLLPMIQTGTGALSMHDVEILRTGYCVRAFDKNLGRGVGILDNSRLPVHDDSLLRIQFYWSVHFASVKAQTEGAVGVHLVSSAPKPAMNLNFDGWDFNLKGMPTKFKKIYVVQSYEEGRQPLVDFMAFKVTKTLNMYMQRASAGNRGSCEVEHVAAGSANANMQLLHSKGISRHHLPIHFGGTYNYDEFDDWIRQRITIEEAMSAAPPIRNSEMWEKPALAAGQKSSNSASSHSEEASLSDAATSEDDKKHQKRSKRRGVEKSRRSAVYSKRYNEKKKQKFAELQKEHKACLAENDDLRREHERLLGLMHEARLAIEDAST